jgi:hypothetical protein
VVKSFIIGFTLISLFINSIYFVDVASTDGKIEENGVTALFFILVCLLLFSGNLGWFLIGNDINSRTHADLIGATGLSYMLLGVINFLLMLLYIICNNWFHMCCDKIRRRLLFKQK